MLYETEIKVLEILWYEGFITAKDLAIRLEESIGWKQSTSYTVINRCVKKGLIERMGTNFTCKALITKEEAQKQEIELLTNKMFNGASDLLVASILGSSKMTTLQMDQLRNMLQEKQQEFMAE